MYVGHVSVRTRLSHRAALFRSRFPLANLRRRSALLFCALLAIGCKDKPTTGALVISVNGLPAGATAAVTVSGPSSFSQQVFQTTTLERLEPGQYTVRMDKVHVGGAGYATPTVSEMLTISAGHTESVTVPYALASGSIDLTVLGLPAGVGPNVALSGPNSFSRSIFAPGLISDLDPGTYTIRADTLVSPDGDRFGATTLTQNVNVTASITAVPATVSYVLASGTLTVNVTGLPSNLASPPVSVTGPASFFRQTAVSATFKGILAGTYTIASANTSQCPNLYTASQSSQTADVAVGGTTTASVSYATSQPPPGSLNLRIDNVHLVQVAQDYSGTTPMVANKPALLRVFAVANQCNTAMPTVRVTLSGSSGRVIDIPATESSVRQSVDQGVLVSSWNAVLTAAEVVPGLTVVAQLDPGNTIAEVSKSDNRFPATGAMSVDVRVIPTVGVRFVPVTVAGTTGNVSLARVDSLLEVARKIHPISSYDVDVRAPYTSSQPAFTNTGGSWNAVLEEIRALRLADTPATNRYYHGIVHVTYNSGVAGIGFVGGQAALSWDYYPSVAAVVAHELGHNYGRFHSPCGNPSGIDPNYPRVGNYAGGFIGSYGYDIATNTLKEPKFYTDIMGYCNLQWISDYTYVGMMTNLLSATSLPDVASAAVEPSLLVWGRIVNGQPVLEPAFEIATRPQLPTRSGPNRVMAVDAGGAEVFSLSFAGEAIADLPGDNESFAFTVPLRMLRGRTLASLQLTARGKTVSNVAAGDVAADAGMILTRAGSHQVRVQWDAAKFPAVMVRDPVSGDILSFARGGDATILTDNDQLELVYSNRISSVREVRRLR